MELLTKEIQRKLPPIGATDGLPVNQKKVIVKFFTPDSNWTWFVLEGEPHGDDYLFFGLVQGFETEFGYFALSELKDAKGPLGLHIERDLCFSGKLPEIAKKILGEDEDKYEYEEA